MVPDETKFAIANGATHDPAGSKTFGAIRHSSLLLVLSSSIFLLSLSHFMSMCAFSTHAAYDDLEPGQPIQVACPAGPETIDALL